MYATKIVIIKRQILENLSTIVPFGYLRQDNTETKRGEKVYTFIETYCKIPEGAQVGQPIKLMKIQKQFMLDFYDNLHGFRLRLAILDEIGQVRDPNYALI